MALNTNFSGTYGITNTPSVTSVKPSSLSTAYTGTYNISNGSVSSAIVPTSSASGSTAVSYSSYLPTTTSEIANAIFGGASPSEIAALQAKASSELSTSSSDRKQSSLAQTITGIRYDDTRYGWAEGVVGSSSMKVKDANGNWVDLETYYSDTYDSNPYTDVYSVKNVLNNVMEKVSDMYSSAQHLQKPATTSSPSTVSSTPSDTEDISITQADLPSGGNDTTFDISEYLTARNIGIVVGILAVLSLLSILLKGD